MEILQIVIVPIESNACAMRGWLRQNHILFKMDDNKRHQSQSVTIRHRLMRLHYFKGIPTTTGGNGAPLDI